MSRFDPFVTENLCSLNGIIKSDHEPQKGSQKKLKDEPQNGRNVFSLRQNRISTLCGVVKMCGKFSPGAWENCADVT